MITLKVKTEVARYSHRQEKLADEINQVFTPLGDIAVSFESKVESGFYRGEPEFRDITTILIPIDDYAAVFDAIANSKVMDETKAILLDSLTQAQRKSENKAEELALHSRLTDLLKGSVFKEIRGGDLVLLSPGNKEIVVSTEYDPVLNFYPEGQEPVELWYLINTGN